MPNGNDLFSFGEERQHGLQQVIFVKLSVVFGRCCPCPAPGEGWERSSTQCCSSQCTGPPGHQGEPVLWKLKRDLKCTTFKQAAAGPQSRSLAAGRAGKCSIPQQDAQDFLQRVKKTHLPIVPAVSRGVLVLRQGQCQFLPWQPRKTRKVFWHFAWSCRLPPSPGRPGTRRDGLPHGC